MGAGKVGLSGRSVREEAEHREVGGVSGVVHVFKWWEPVEAEGG
mgnify:CR=1 FL=1